MACKLNLKQIVVHDLVIIEFAITQEEKQATGKQ